MTRTAIGFSLAFDHSLHADLAPLDRLLACDVVGLPLLKRFTRVHWSRVETMQGKDPGEFNWPTLRPRIVRGECATFSPGNLHRWDRDPDDIALSLMVGTCPLSELPRMPEHNPEFPTTLLPYRFAFSFAVGSLYLAEPGIADAVIDSVFEFASAVQTQVGAVVAAPSHYAANALATGSSGSRDPALSARSTELFFARRRWGPFARAPEWGTFLKRAHVEAIGGVERLRALAPYRVLEHDSVVLVQLTRYEDALTPRSDALRADLAALMTPVLSPPPAGVGQLAKAQS